jgi:Flp pilus assembly protein TadD
LLRNGNTLEAISALERACAGPTPDPRYFFHLALAYLKSGKHDEARTAMARAEKLDLGDTALTAEERLSLDSLQRQLAEK